MLAFAGGTEILLIASVLLTAGAILSRKKPQIANLDDSIESNATQGAYIPLVIGRKKPGHVVAWTEDTTPGTDSLLDGGPGGTPGLGKGQGSAPSQPNYTEKALHILAVGPGNELRNITQNNEILWEGLATPETHPSGTLIECLLEPTSHFRIYWGFPDDPILPYLGASLTHGIATRYPCAMKILWDDKDLGQSRQWARLEYEASFPCYSQIASSPSEVPRTGNDAEPRWDYLVERGWYFDTGSAQTGNPFIRYFTTSSSGSSVTRVVPTFERVWVGGITFNAVERSIVTLGPEQLFSGQVSNIDVWGDVVFPINGVIKVRSENIASGITTPGGGGSFGPSLTELGFTADNQDKFFRIKNAEHVTLSGGILAYKIYLGEEIDVPTYIQNRDPTSQPTPVPTTIYWPPVWLSPVDSFNTDGINPIHIIDQLLFAKFPYGAARNRSKFDAFSIEVAAERLQKELIRGGCMVKDGESLESVLAAYMQDIGLTIPFNPDTGKYTFRLLRYESGAIDLSEAILLSAPEIETIRGDRPVDHIAFTFKDRVRGYRDVPVRVSDNGQIFENDSVRAQKAPIEITNDRDSVSRIAPRRGQEALGSLSTLRIELNHQGFNAVASSRFSLSPFEDANVHFIITDVLRDVNSSKVVINSILDTYAPPDGSSGLALSQLLEAPPTGIDQPSSTPALADFFAIEIPRALSSDRRKVELFLGASRRSGKTLTARFWISGDGLSFTVHGTAPIVARGTLRNELPANGDPIDDNDHTFDSDYQLDIDSVEDLTLYLDSWRAGRQILLIGDEIIFLRDAVVTVPGSPCEGTFSGLIRGRAGTRAETHAPGTPFYIFLAHRLDAQTSPAFLPGKEIYYKAESISLNAASGIAEVVEKSVVLTGKALTPITPSALRLGLFEAVYNDAADPIRFDWSYHSKEFPRTGYGHQTLGAATGISRPGGHFIVRVYDEFDDLVHQETTTNAYFELSDALRTTLSLDNGNPWTFAVIHVEGSFSSPEAALTIQST